MSVERFLDGRVSLHCGDALEVLAAMPAACVDAVVTDPPYHLTTGKNGGTGPASLNLASPAGRARISTGFMGKCWDGGDVAFQAETWAACLRVLKPGGHLVAFGGSRTFDLMAGAIRAAGFEVRDSILSLYDASPHWAALIESMSPVQLGALAAALGGSEPGLLAWLYGQGFPKSHDVAKAIDKVRGVQGMLGGPKTAAHAGWIERGSMRGAEGHEGYQRSWMADQEAVDRNARTYLPGSPEAAAWDGWGTALKPAFEPIILARRPLAEPSVARQVLATGTGAVNVGGCAIATDEDLNGGTHCGERRALPTYTSSDAAPGATPLNRLRNGAGEYVQPPGRWPANVVTDGSDAVTGLFPETHPPGNRTPSEPYGSVNFGADRAFDPARNRTDSGTAARFFYTAKATKHDRITRYVEEVMIEWTSESGPSKVQLQVDTGQSHERATVVSASTKDNGWSTSLFGDTIMEIFRKASNCTISTATSSTTESKTWNWLMRSLTSACTADVSCGTVNGGSPAGNAGRPTRYLSITLAETVSLPGASHAVSGTQLKISVSGRLHGHPTCKPVALMQWLVKLVTPPGGVLLDPFAGTGTTAEAAFREGFSAVLVERDAEYQADIRERMRLVLAGPATRKAETHRQRAAADDHGPLFAGAAKRQAAEPFDDEIPF